mmetsp:Transcript_67915/g.100752  ORF Transcript_67915/g.100752 Transcript_67915/m.100752 type:complete len:81 (+) Transcript_67915:1092-1334(+)
MFWMRVVCLSNGSIVFIFEAGKKEMKTHKLKRRKERKEYKQHWHLFKQWKTWHSKIKSIFENLLQTHIYHLTTTTAMKFC